MRAFRPILALLLALLAPRGSAAAPAAPPAPADQEPNWTVGVAAFSGRNLEAENQYLRHSFPLALRERLSGVRLHFFGEEEREGYRRAVIRRATRRQVEELEKLRGERDALFFQDQRPASWSASARPTSCASARPSRSWPA
jgi:hypothetical protein